MKRIQIYSLAIVAALVPAALGLWGNASFSRDLPVRVPARAETTTASSSPVPGRAGADERDRDDHGEDDGGQDDGCRDDDGGGRDDHARDD